VGNEVWFNSEKDKRQLRKTKNAVAKNWNMIFKALKLDLFSISYEIHAWRLEIKI
jgi:hypothetical protein